MQGFSAEQSVSEIERQTERQRERERERKRERERTYIRRTEADGKDRNGAVILLQLLCILAHRTARQPS